MLNSYKDLIVWQKSMNLVKDIYMITNSFPKSEIFGLVGQMRRAAVSIPSNIAEGFCRRSKKEYRQFLSIAFASVAELSTQLILSEELKFMEKTTFDDINSLCEEVSKMLNKMISTLSIAQSARG